MDTLLKGGTKIGIYKEIFKIITRIVYLRTKKKWQRKDIENRTE